MTVIKTEPTHFEIDVPGAKKYSGKSSKPLTQKTALFIPTTILNKLPSIQAKSNERFVIYTDVNSIVRSVLLHGKTGKRYGLRGLENDPTKQQLIIYNIVLSCDGKSVLMYQRNDKGDERLHKNYSIGFGGHIEESDNKQLQTLALAFHLMYKEIAMTIALEEASQRELAEEIGINEEDTQIQFVSAYREKYTQEEVKKSKKISVHAVHTGILALAKLNSKRMQNRTLKLPVEEFSAAEWVPLKGLKQRLAEIDSSGAQMELWSRFVINEFTSIINNAVKELEEPTIKNSNLRR